MEKANRRAGRNFNVDKGSKEMGISREVNWKPYHLRRRGEKEEEEKQHYKIWKRF